MSVTNIIPDRYDGEPNLTLFNPGDFRGLVMLALNLFLLMNLGLTFFMLIVAGIKLITSGGDKYKIIDAWGSIPGIVVGLVLSIFAATIIIIIRASTGADIQLPFD